MRQESASFRTGGLALETSLEVTGVGLLLSTPVAWTLRSVLSGIFGKRYSTAGALSPSEAGSAQLRCCQLQGLGQLISQVAPPSFLMCHEDVTEVEIQHESFTHMISFNLHPLLQNLPPIFYKS